MEWKKDAPMEVAVVRLADGYTTRFPSTPIFSAHHANAQNLPDGRFVLDICPTAHEGSHIRRAIKSYFSRHARKQS